MDNISDEDREIQNLVSIMNRIYRKLLKSASIQIKIHFVPPQIFDHLDLTKLCFNSYGNLKSRRNHKCPHLI